MNLRTPRRRVSPRTKRRYRAIKNFLRRTLGSSCQLDNKINSSLTVSVSNLEQRIVGLEQQLNTVGKHCQDLAGLEYNLKSPRISTISTHVENNAEFKKDIEAYPLTKIEKKVLHKTPRDHYCTSTKKSKSTSKLQLDNNENGNNETFESKMTSQINSYKEKARNKHDYRLGAIQESEQTLRNGKNHHTIEIYKSSYPLKNFHSFPEPATVSRYKNPKYSEIHGHRKSFKGEYFDTTHKLRKESNVQLVEQRFLENKRNYKNKHEHPELDQDFIADIIRRQYRPIKLLGRKESDFSQFSAPICRDQEFSFRETVQEDNELCSCCHEGHRQPRYSKYMCNNDYSDTRSICDTRLYSSRKHKQHSNRRKRFEDYNNSEMYDIIPVKEKCSPKSRRKLVEDNILMYERYKEVPPSPRTQRPRLNLQAQLHTEDKDEGLNVKERIRYNKHYKSLLQQHGNCSNILSDVFIHNRNGERIQKQQVPNILQSYNTDVVEPQTNVQYALLNNDQLTNNNDITLNTQTTDNIAADKTDKTLGEIKDILQNFLLEIKKESSQSNNVNSTPQYGIENLNESHQQSNSRNAMYSSGNSFNNNNSFGQCRPPYMPSFPNPCCYPILPICPMNCIQNGFVVPSPSFTCATCANDSKERTCENIHSPNSEVTNSETQKLIKEIHKLISQNPNTIHNKESFKSNTLTLTKNQKVYSEAKTLKSRSVGGSSEASKYDAKVGTPTMKCYSKSCEAIGSRIATSAQKNLANTSYSDTVLEKGSSEIATTTQSTSESDYSSDTTVVKTKRNKFTNMLRSIGLFKKNKNEDIEELSESPSGIEVPTPKRKPPFQQNLINYNVHDQQYFQPPSMSSYPFHQIHHNEYFNHAPCQHSRSSYSPNHVHNKKNNSNGKTLHDQSMRSYNPLPCHGSMSPCTNYYEPHFSNLAPQVPVCLKEIEVKSIGTQSIRKMSLLQKITNKMQVSEQKRSQPSQNQSSTQTAKAKNGANIFDWKKLQEKAMQNTADPMKFSHKTQKRLAEGDFKMRNAMLKKLFYKRNPFSPRNLLVRTLLGKDISSFGEPPKMYKPRMFL